MKTQTAIPTEAPADRVLAITRVFNAPRSLVYTAWAEKGHIDQWCAPRGFTIPSSDGDVRPGGAWRSTMRSPDGTDYRLRGKYIDVIENELLRFTHAWEEEPGKYGPETTVEVHFIDAPQGKTEMQFEQRVFPTAESRDSHAGGWNEAFDRLEEFLPTIRD